MKFEFGIPEHGWLDFKISQGELEIELGTSDVPNNYLEALAVALNNIKNGSLREKIEISLEPDYASCLFLVNNETIDVEVYLDRSKSDPFKFSDTKNKVMHSLYKSLRDLESLECWQSPDCNEKIWSWPFPQKELSAYKQNTYNKSLNRDATSVAPIS